MVQSTTLRLIFIYLVLTISLIIYRRRTNKLMELVKRPDWLIIMIAITLWSIYILKFNAFGHLSNDHKKLKRLKISTIHGLIALVIATLAYLDITTPTFWLVLFVSYLLEAEPDDVYA